MKYTTTMPAPLRMPPFDGLDPREDEKKFKLLDNFLSVVLDESKPH